MRGGAGVDHAGTIRTSSFGTAGLLAAALLLIQPAPATAQPCTPVTGELVSVEGTVELSRAAVASFEPAALGATLCVGDAVRTGPLSRAEVALANDSVLRLDEGTVLQLREQQPAEPTFIEMVFGAIYFFSHRPRSLQIDTPFVNAGAEGTEFLVRVDDRRTEIVVYDGRVVAENAAGELGLGSGDAAVASAGTAPSPVTIVRPRDRVAWAIYYPPILTPLAGGEAPLPSGLARASRAATTGDYAAALATLDEVPEPSRDGRYQVFRAGVLLGVGRIDAAEEAIRQALLLGPDDGDALAQRAIIRIARNDVAAGLQDSKAAVAASPTSAPTWIARSYALQAAGRIEDARDALLRGREAAPDDPLVLARLAEMELARGDLDAALEAAERAASLAPDLARTQIVLGYAELLRVDTEDALASFDRAIQRDPANPLPRLGRGLAIIRDGDLETGRRELEIAVGLDPDDAVIRSYLGKAFFEERRDERAADQLQIAKDLDPNDPTPWFYDAIRKQLENRPVEALRDLETAIALNDNRAVYRSSFLLDQDLATRSVSLARIYDDLGFDQLAVTEASRSLSRDPASWSAHRFLSDAYARLPRHEIARVSELLQAQLLQPININSVQPSLAISDLSTIAGTGPAEGAFNEFHPLFERNRAQLTASGVLGNNDTLGNEVVASGVWESVSLSAGQFHSQTDGFRANSDIRNDAYNGFAQWAVTPKLNLLTEIRYRDTEQGDIVQDFQEGPGDDDQRELEEDVFRLGGRYSVAPSTDIVVAAAHIDRDEAQTIVNPLAATVDRRIAVSSEDKGYQVEGQVRSQFTSGSLVVGAGTVQIDVEEEEANSLVFADGSVLPLATTEQSSDLEQVNVYGYGKAYWPDDVIWTLGLGYASVDDAGIEVDEVAPKLGVEWQATDWLNLRAAAFRTVKPAIVADQTIEPTTIAGFNQFFDDLNGSVVDRFGLGADARLSEEVYVGVEASRRDLDVPRLLDGVQVDDEQQEDLIRAYANWLARDDLVVTVEVRYEMFEADDVVNPDIPVDLDTLAVPVTLRYFADSGLFGEFTTTFLHQEVERQAASDLPGGSEANVLFDAAVGYRFPGRRGLVSLEARNILDERFPYQDDNFRSSEQRLGEFIPERSLLARLTLSF